MRKITFEQLKSWLHYNPKTGIFVYSGNPKPGVVLGKIASFINPKNGYEYVYCLGKQYRANVLAWFYMTGEWPENEIDHINNIKNDNTFENLREATRTQNMQNINKPSSNTSGFKGATYHKGADKWCSQIRINGKKKWLGTFLSLEDAALAYNFAALKYFGEFANLNKAEI